MFYHPRNDDQTFPSWSTAQKWAITLVVSSYAFLSPLSSSMMAPAANDIAHDLGESNKTVIALFTSIYVAAYGTSPTHVWSVCLNKASLRQHSVL